jgi:chorismate mutase
MSLADKDLPRLLTEEMDLIELQHIVITLHSKVARLNRLLTFVCLLDVQELLCRGVLRAVVVLFVRVEYHGQSPVTFSYLIL